MNKATCAGPECDREVEGRQPFCRAHYNQKTRGKPLTPLRRRGTGTPEERFWAFVNKTDGGCWLWTGCTVPKGHGHFTGTDGKLIYAHKFAWELLVGPIPKGLVLDHDNPKFGCGNPACVNPAHTEPVTNRINVQRGRGIQKNNTSGYRGVSWNTRRQKWKAQFGEHFGGYFDAIEDANRAADALRKVRTAG